MNITWRAGRQAAGACLAQSLADDPRDDDPPEVAFYCPACGEREFGTLETTEEP